MSVQELKGHAKNAGALDMQLFLENPEYRFAMEDENPWIQGTLQIERRHIFGTILASSEVALTDEQQKMLKHGYARLSMTENQGLKKTLKNVPKEKLAQARTAMADTLKRALGEEQKEIDADDERLEEFRESPDSQAEIERFAQMEKLPFDKFNSDRLFRLLVRTHNPIFQEISARERLFAMAKVLDWAQPLGLTADQIEAVAAMAPKGGKELLEATAAGYYLETKRKARKAAGGKKEEQVMAAFEELKRDLMEGEITPGEFSRQVTLKTNEILQGKPAKEPQIQ